MRERKPLEEVIYEIVEIVLTILLIILFLFVLVTHGKVVPLIDLTFAFGILMNVLAAVFSNYKGRKKLAALHVILAGACLAVILI